VGRGARLACDSRVLPVTWPAGSDGVLLVRPLQSLAPDLEVEESNSELAQKDTIFRPRGIGIGSCGRKRSAIATGDRAQVFPTIRMVRGWARASP
jgi:hypothetical protein